MTVYSKYNLVYRLQKWMDSVPGQTFLNYAYSWGASVVILGTLFKLTHLAGANIALFLGMGTEVFVFFISAFDRPFDKTAEGRDLPTHLEEEEGEETDGEVVAENAGPAVQGVPYAGTVIIGGGNVSAGTSTVQVDEGQSAATAAAVGQPGVAAVSGATWVAGQQETAPGLVEAQSNYVDELRNLTETLQKVSEQSARLTRDSEEMENLNRTLTGICKVYEMQLKSASQQIGTIDEINDQSRKMAQQIEQLNKIYARMIEAMTVNMRAAAPGAGE